MGSVLSGLSALGTIASGSVFTQTGYDHGEDMGPLPLDKIVTPDA